MLGLFLNLRVFQLPRHYGLLGNLLTLLRGIGIVLLQGSHSAARMVSFEGRGVIGCRGIWVILTGSCLIVDSGDVIGGGALGSWAGVVLELSGGVGGLSGVILSGVVTVGRRRHWAGIALESGGGRCDGIGPGTLLRWNCYRWIVLEDSGGTGGSSMGGLSLRGGTGIVLGRGGWEKGRLVGSPGWWDRHCGVILRRLLFLLLEYWGRLGLRLIVVVIIVVSVKDLRIRWLVLVVLVGEGIVVLVSLDNFCGCAGGRDHVFVTVVAVLDAVVVVDRLVGADDEGIGDVDGLLIAVGPIFSQVETIDLTLSLAVYVVLVGVEVVGVKIRFGGVVVTAVVVVDLEFVEIGVVIGEIVGCGF